MLKCYHMHDCKHMDTPVEKNSSLSLDMCSKTPDENKQMSKVLYFSIVDSFMNAMMCTHPDICHAIGVVSRFQSNQSLKYWMTMKRILRYLK